LLRFNCFSLENSVFNVPWEQGGEKRMADRLKMAGIALAVAAMLFPAVAHAQGKKGSHAAPTTDSKPKVDEKAYKAALDRIPTPKKAYDPWGQVHDSETGPKSPGKSN
jgi:hypothetical protein